MREVKCLGLIGAVMLCGQPAMAQNNPFRAEYEAFRRQAREEHENFREQANREYADFVRRAWQEFQAKPAVPKPKEKEVPPLERPKGDSTVPTKSEPVKTEQEPVTLPEAVPQPAPVSPIREQQGQQTKVAEFLFYGTSMQVRLPENGLFSLNAVTHDGVADAWRQLATADYDNTIRDCLALRMKHRLGDWAYLQMIEKMAMTCVADKNKATLLMAYIYQQSGYAMRLATTAGQLRMLFSTKHQIFGKSYFQISGERFYVYGPDVTPLHICEVSYPQEKALSLLITEPMDLGARLSEERVLTSEGFPDMTVKVGMNQNLLDFYTNYPASMLNSNQMTRWAMYANTPLHPEQRERLEGVLREKIAGLSEKDAVERLLNWVQTAFKYEYDETVWGHDRVFFAEETLYYPYCDCEDRSILLSRLVRDLLGLKVILVYYPGHLAMAVGFTEDVAGDYIMQGGKRYVVCDPTYINAPVGMTMPDMNNQTARIILLE